MSREQHMAVSQDPASVRRLAESLVGLKADEAMRTLRKCLLARGKADAGLADAVMDAKRKALQTEGLLEPVRRDASFADVAGLKHLREWLAKRHSAFTPEGRRFGLVAAQGRAHHRRARMRQESGGARDGGRMGHRAGAFGCGRALRQVRRRKREAAAQGARIVAASWRPWCCGSTRSRRRLHRRERAAMRTRDYRSGCWRRC